MTPITEVSDDPELGDKVMGVKITSAAVTFINSAVIGFIDGKYGDPDDPKKVKLANELRDDLHEIWKLFNPS